MLHIAEFHLVLHCLPKYMYPLSVSIMQRVNEFWLYLLHENTCVDHSLAHHQEPSELDW